MIGRLRTFLKAASTLQGVGLTGWVPVFVRLIQAGVFLFPLTLTLLVLRPFVDIRFRPIYADRIGHLVLETDIFISQLEKEKPRFLVLCFFVGGPANSFFARLVRNRVRVVSPVLGATGYFVQRTLFELNYPRLPGTIQQTRKILTKQSAWVSDELSWSRLQVLLENLGADPESPYVCLWVRDSVYGTLAMPGTDQYFAHYRDASVGNYHRMCRVLQSYGYSVIRMGRKGVIESSDPSPPYFDYLSAAVNSEENDFLLAKHCSFAICGDSGSSAIPLLYRRPIALTNLGSFIGAISAESVRVIAMKRLEWIESGQPLTSSEIKKYGVHKFNDTKQFDSIGIRHVENSERQLEGVALDMLDLMENYPDGTPTLKGLQVSFREKVRLLLDEEPAFLAGNLWLEDNPQFAQ